MSETSTESGTWSVWRIDDTGNTFLVKSGLPRGEADRLAAEFERRGHKQMYWVESDVPQREITAS
jgi:hypothetical protein